MIFNPADAFAYAHFLVETRAMFEGRKPTAEEYQEEISRQFHAAVKANTESTLQVAGLAQAERRRRRGLFGWL